MQDFASDETGTFKIEHGFDDFVYLAHAPNWMLLRKETIRLGPMHGRLGCPGGHSVDTDSGDGLIERAFATTR